jgi:hypothetical protein
VKYGDMDNTKIVEQLLVDLGIPASELKDNDLRDRENYCILRAATKQCTVSRTDCVERCNPPASKTRIWG